MPDATPPQPTSRPLPRPWYTRKRWYALAAVAAVLSVAGGFLAPPLVQPMGGLGKFDTAMDEEVARVQPRAGQDAWPLIQAIAKDYSAAVSAEVERRKSEPDYNPVPNLYPYYDAIFVPEGTPQASPDDVEHGRVAQRVLDRLDEAGIWGRFDALSACGFSAPVRARGIALCTVDDLVGGELRSLCRALVARMKVAARHGDQAGVVACFRRAMDLGRLTPPDDGVISALYRVSIEQTVLTAVREEVAAGRLSPESLAQLDGVLRDYPRLHSEHYYAVERVRGLDMIEWMHTDNGKGDGYFSPGTLPLGVGEGPRIGAGRAGRLAGVLFESKAACRGKYLGFVERFSRELDGNEPVPVVIARNTPDLDALSKRRTVLLGIMLPALGTTVRVGRSCEMHRDGTRIIVAIGRYRADHGFYPTGLDALEPAYLERVPVDRFTMRPFGFVAAPGSEPRWCSLYSLGYDLQDNSGAPAARSVQDALTEKGAGTDYVLGRLGDADQASTSP